MKSKPILAPQRLRKIPSQFSWIDHRFVREGHIQRPSPEALALYLLLLCVGDQHGLSYYSDKTAARLLSMSLEALGKARGRLLDAGLIAFDPPFYQVLSLDPPAPTAASSSSQPTEAQSAADILYAILSQEPKFHPRFLDFCAHYGIEPIACNVRSPQEKGRVESAVCYVKSNLLSGLTITRLGPLGRLTSIPALDSTANQINRFGYQYDRAGQRWQRTVESNTVERVDTFFYNDRRELIGVTSRATNYNYGWSRDPIGNWISYTNNGQVTTYTKNNLNQYTAISDQVTAPKYDANDNITNYHIDNFTWDADDRLIQHRRPTGYSNFSYDGLKRLVEILDFDADGNNIASSRLTWDNSLASQHRMNSRLDSNTPAA